MPILICARSQDRGGMRSCHYGRQPLDFFHDAVIDGYPEAGSQERLSGDCAETDDQLRLDRVEFCIKPGATGANLCDRGLFVEPDFAARLPFEVLDRICDVDFAPLDTGLIEAVIQKPACRSHERAALNILAIAGLLANHHEGRCAFASPSRIFPFTKDGLGRLAIEIAAVTALNRHPQADEGVILRHELQRAFVPGPHAPLDATSIAANGHWLAKIRNQELPAIASNSHGRCGIRMPMHANRPRRNVMSNVNTMERLFVEELKDLYSAEHQITKALPKMAKAASSKELRAAFENHLKETEGHIQRLDQVFETLGAGTKGETKR
jgi:hypothetical protein